MKRVGTMGLCLVAVFSSGMAAATASAAPSPPTVATEPATAITNSSATLNATVNPNGQAVTECKLEYGTTTAYGQSAPCTPSPGSGSSAVAVSAAVGFLNGSTTYHFRVSATSAGGTSTGPDQTFTTLSPPHWQKSGAKTAEGETVATISWGTITLESQAPLGTVTCRTASAANIENTALTAKIIPGVAAAKGETELFATYECKAVGGECVAKGGETRVGAPGLPSLEEIREEGENSRLFREESAGVQLNIECYKEGLLTEHVLFKSGPVGAETGTFTPAFLNGSMTDPAIPSEVIFDASSGHLFAETEGLTLTIKGKLKVEGYEGTPVSTITLGPTAPEPTATATAITNSSATLNATVNPSGQTVTECKFEYGTTPSYGQSAPCTPSPGSGTSPVTVSATVGGLSGLTTYHFRISATNSGGTGKGGDETFTTLSPPHWRKNGAKTTEGETVATISWGTITLESQAPLGTVTCRTASAANIENTASAPKGETELFATYECKATGGECVAKGGETRVGAPALPWLEQSKEEGGGTERYREESAAAQLNIECYKAGLLTEHALFKSGPVGAETGTFTPSFANGSTPGRPSEVVFDSSSGHLLSEAGGLKLTMKGRLKIEGYEGTPVPIITLGA